MPVLRVRLALQGLPVRLVPLAPWDRLVPQVRRAHQAALERQVQLVPPARRALTGQVCLAGPTSIPLALLWIGTCP